MQVPNPNESEKKKLTAKTQRAQSFKDLNPVQPFKIGTLKLIEIPDFRLVRVA